MSNGYTPLTTNAQGQAAPSGYHYMPDGTLMRNADMQIKNISGFVLDTSDIKEAGEARSFVIAGDNGAEFTLEIKNEDGYYYNFVTNTFQAAQAKLDETITGVIILLRLISLQSPMRINMMCSYMLNPVQNTLYIMKLDLQMVV
jgi:hypothetical protein